MTTAGIYPIDWKPKGLREHLCAQMVNCPDQLTLEAMHRLCNILDLHRPLGPDGKHGNRHTPTCGCDDVIPETVPVIPESVPEAIEVGPIPESGRPAKPKRSGAQDAEVRTCDRCGRIGSRQFRMIGPDTWVCTREDSCAKKVAEIQQRIAQDEVSRETPTGQARPATIRPGSEPVDPTGLFVAEPQADIAEITAKCTDCPRSWVLREARILKSAVEMHEMKHSHIVEVYLQEEAKA
jgi:hypothetical protein